MLLAGRVRHEDEMMQIKEVIEKHMKRKVDADNLFTPNNKTSATTKHILEMLMQANMVHQCSTTETNNEKYANFSHIVWTFNMRRMAVLIGQALLFKEPVLLV